MLDAPLQHLIGGVLVTLVATVLLSVFLWIAS